MRFFVFLFFYISVLNAQDIYIKAMKDEISRSINKLVMEGFSSPYFISYLNYDTDFCKVSLSFGDIEYINDDRYNVFKSEVRVGSVKFDNSNYATDLNRYTPYYSYMPSEANYDAVRHSLWYLTDEAYKNAIEVYSKKDGYRKKKDIKETYDEFLPSEKIEYFEKTDGKKNKCDKYTDILKNISMLSRKYERIKSSNLTFYHSYNIKRYADSQGSSFITASPFYSLELNVEMLDKNNFLKKDNKKFFFFSDDNINNDLLIKIDNYLKEISESYDSDLIDYYLGPAVFEEEASAEFFNNLFVRNISFYPPVESEKEEYISYYYDVPKLVDRLGKRVISGFIDIYDDPSETKYGDIELAGSYKIDDEAVRPKRIELVKNGILKNIYTSRRATKYSSSSNGHGRGGYYMYNYPFSGNVFIKSQKKLSYSNLIEEAKKIAREQNMNEILVIKKLSPGFSDQVLGYPVIAYLLDINTGQKRYISVSKFEGIGLRSLRDIAYTEDKDFVYNFEQRGPFYNSQSVLSSIISPRSILVTEVELVKSDKKPEKKPYLPNPYFKK